MGEWTTCSLGELISAAGGTIRTGPFGSQLHANEYTDDPRGVPVVMPKDMVDGRVALKSVSRVTEVTAQRLKVHRMEGGDLVLARRGDIGRLAFIAPDEAGWLCGTGSMRIHAPDHDVLDPGFLRFAMSAPGVTEWLSGQAVGATMPNLNAAIVAAIPLAVPKVGIQRQVARLLGAFEELLEINRRRIETLERLARSLYREWFVHFQIPGDKNVELVDSELGRVPREWSICPLFEIAEVAFGYPFKSAGFKKTGRFPVVRIRDIPHGVTATYANEEPDPRYRVVDGDILIGMDGMFHIKQWAGGEAWLNQRVARLRPLRGMGSRHLMLAVTGPIRRWNESIVGTTVAHLGKRHLEEIRVAVPPPELLNDAGSALDSLGMHQMAAEQQIRKLVATRDLLLPRLVSGQLDISDIDLGMLAPSRPEN